MNSLVPCNHYGREWTKSRTFRSVPGFPEINPRREARAGTAFLPTAGIVSSEFLLRSQEKAVAGSQPSVCCSRKHLAPRQNIERNPRVRQSSGVAVAPSARHDPQNRSIRHPSVRCEDLTRLLARAHGQAPPWTTPSWERFTHPVGNCTRRPGEIHDVRHDQHARCLIFSKPDRPSRAECHPALRGITHAGGGNGFRIGGSSPNLESRSINRFEVASQPKPPTLGKPVPPSSPQAGHTMPLGGAWAKSTRIRVRGRRGSFDEHRHGGQE